MNFFTNNTEEIKSLNNTLYRLEFENKLNLLEFIDLYFADIYEQVKNFTIVYLLISCCIFIVSCLILEIMKKHIIEKVKFEKITSVKSITEIPVSVLENNSDVFALCEEFLKNN